MGKIRGAVLFLVIGFSSAFGRASFAEDDLKGAAPAAAPAEEVVRAAAGDWGMFFRFGGLATLLAGNNTRTIGGLTETQVGMKAVLSDELHLPFFVGAGLRNVSPENQDAITDVGLEAGIGLEYHFRVWKRISPFIGAQIGAGFAKPSGADKLDLGFGAGPVVGVEYYVADHLSLSAQYLLTFSFNTENGVVVRQPDGTTAVANTTAIQINTLAGGALNLTFYF